MLNNNMKAIFKKYLLALTFLVGFFALSGYVSHSIAGNNRVSETELFTGKNFNTKGGISYKRVAQAFYNHTFSYAANDTKTYRIIIYNRLTQTHYQHLEFLCLSFKQCSSYPIDHLYYTSNQHSNLLFSPIG